MCESTHLVVGMYVHYGVSSNNGYYHIGYVGTYVERAFIRKAILLLPILNASKHS